MHAFPLVELDIGGDVHDQPALLEFQILHAGTDFGPHHAVGPVAAQQILGLYGVFVTVDAVGEGDQDSSVPAVGNAGDLGVGAKRGL